MIEEIATLAAIIVGYAIAQHTLKKQMKTLPYATAFLAGLLTNFPISIFVGILSGSEGYVNRKPLPACMIACVFGIIANYILRHLLNFP